MTLDPYCLAKLNPAAETHCCDVDESIASIHEHVGRSEGGSVSFRAADLRDLPHDAGTFDALYCISVLENTDHYLKILNEFQRVPKSKGRWLVTFDISLDGSRDISKDGALALPGELEIPFRVPDDLLGQVTA